MSKERVLLQACSLFIEMRANGDQAKLLAFIDTSMQEHIDSLINMETEHKMYRLQGAIKALQNIRDIISEPDKYAERLQG